MPHGYSQDLKWRIVWSCFYRSTSCEEAAETFFVSVRTVASSRRYLLSTPKWSQGSEVSCESNDNRDNHTTSTCTSIPHYFDKGQHQHNRMLWLIIETEYLHKQIIAQRLSCCSGKRIQRINSKIQLLKVDL